MVGRILRAGTWLSRVTLVLVALTGLVSCGSDNEASKEAESNEAKETIGAVRNELINMMVREQSARDYLDSVVALAGWRSPQAEQASRQEELVDSTNQARLMEIITRYGWPGRPLVGPQAALAAFMVLQHADLAFQLEYLPMFRHAVGRGDAERSHLAMLWDRILMRQDKLQIYGTQLWNDPSTGKLGLYPLNDSTDVDSLRREVGLGPLNAYLEDMGVKPEQTKPGITVEF